MKSNGNFIRILMVMLNNGEAAFVEYYSKSDDRSHIIKADRFAETFGYTLDELKNHPAGAK